MDATTIVSFLLLVLEAYLFTGIIFGFPNLRVILESEGIWTCNGTEAAIDAGECNDQSNYSQVSLLAILMGNLMSLPLGLILDRNGTLACRIACTLFITVGFILLFFVDQAPNLLYVSLPCLGAGGFTLLTSNFQLSILTNIAGLVVLAIQAGFGASGTLFRVFLAAGASSKATAGLMLGLTSIIWIRSLFFMPKYHIKKGQQNLLVELRPLCSHNSDQATHQSGNERQDEDLKTSTATRKSLYEKIKEAPIMGECGQAAFMAFLFWFSVGNSFITYYVSSMNDWAVWVDGVDNDLVNLFGILLALTVFFGPSAGIIIDAITSRLSNKYGTEGSACREVGVAFTICMNVFFAIVVCILASFQNASLAIAAMVIFQAHRIYTYGVAAAYLQATFAQQFFGSLMGLGRLVIGLTSLINLPIIAAVENDTITFVHVFIGYAVASTFTLCLPIMSLRKAMASL